MKKKFLIIIIVSVFLNFPAFAHNWMAPQDEAEKINPVPKTQESFNRGKILYQNNCRGCHGENAAGMPAKLNGLNKKTPNLITRLKTHTEGDFHWKIKTGKEEMPSFKKHLSDNETWDIINYFSSLPD